MKYGTFALALLLGVFLAGGTANAQLTGAVTTAVDVDVDAGADGSGAGVSGSVGGSADAGTADSDDSTTGSDDGSMGGDTTSASSDTASNGSLNFSLSRSSLDEEGSASVSSASDVTTSDSFRAYAAGELQSDENFKSIDMSDDGMDIEYRRPARLFGLFPTSMNVRVHVDGNGDVSVRYPWYSFLLAKGESRDELAARLTADLSTLAADMTLDTAAGNDDGTMDQGSGDVTASGSATASGNVSLETRRFARALERIQATLSADADASADAKASSY